MSITKTIFGFLIGLPFGLIVGFAMMLHFGQHHEDEVRKQAVRQVLPDARDVYALALNIYHETRGVRGPNEEGWRAVSGVVFNRLADRRFPRTVRGIVYDPGPAGGTCAFSWYCDGKTDYPADEKLFREIKKAAFRYMLEHTFGLWEDPIAGAHSYHSTGIPPNRYFRRLEPVGLMQEGEQGHLFYRDPKG